MELDAKTCYQAFVRHDRRFDGRVFAGIVTTGIYCRPVCPVVTAKFENARFFACAAAAEAAGFRPCLRCRPEAAPGTPAWLGTSAVVSRALRLIGDTGIADDNIEAFALRLGVGARQLRRLFAQHLGASPVQIARARRVHFARRLIDETTLSMSTIAFAAGFASIRQFNHAMRATFRQTPTALRQRRGRRGPLGDDGGLAVRLPYRPPFDWAGIVSFLAPRATPGVECVDATTYRRTIDIDGTCGAITVCPGADDAAHLVMHVRLPRYDDLLRVVERARRFFDLDADPLQIGGHLRRSARLRRAVRAAPGLRVPGAWDGFELAVRAILGQQVTVRGATTLAGRLVCTFGTAVDGGGDGLTHCFPRPEALADADLARIGLPRARAATIRGLAAAVCRGELTLDASQGLEDAVARLQALPGVGEWTAHYIAMRAFGEPDAFPASDLGLRHALTNGAGPPSARAVAHLAEGWRPWRAYAAMYLWNGAGRNGHDH